MPFDHERLGVYQAALEFIIANGIDRIVAMRVGLAKSVEDRS